MDEALPRHDLGSPRAFVVSAQRCRRLPGFAHSSWNRRCDWVPATDWEHEIHLPVEPLSASRARAFVCRHLVEHRLLQLVAPIRLVASELATHAIIHSDTPFTVTLSMTDDVVTLSVHDDSRARASAIRHLGR